MSGMTARPPALSVSSAFVSALPVPAVLAGLFSQTRKRTRSARRCGQQCEVVCFPRGQSGPVGPLMSYGVKFCHV
eukprot:4388861-Lingulodinium_polyedra.AAC.1